MSEKFTIPAQVADTSDPGTLTLWVESASVALRIEVPYKPTRTAWVLRSQLRNALDNAEEADDGSDMPETVPTRITRALAERLLAAGKARIDPKSGVLRLADEDSL